MEPSFCNILCALTELLAARTAVAATGSSETRRRLVPEAVVVLVSEIEAHRLCATLDHVTIRAYLTEQPETLRDHDVVFNPEADACQFTRHRTMELVAFLHGMERA